MKLTPTKFLLLLVTPLAVAFLTSSPSALSQTKTRSKPVPQTGDDTVHVIQPPVAPLDGQRLDEVLRQLQGGLRLVRPDLAKADRMMMEGHYDEALALLLPMWKKDPGDEMIATSLKQAYRGLKDYSGVLEVLRTQLGSHPKEAAYLADLADTWWKLDQNDSAMATVGQLIASDPKDADRYRVAAETYARAGKYREGIETYRDARKILGDSVLFAENLAQIFEARREYATAIDEYFRWLRSRPDARSAVQHRITNLIKLPEAAGEITAALKRIVKESPNDEYAHRLYGDLLFESGLVDTAFAEYRRADHFASQPGEHQLYGIMRSLETQHYATARAEAMSFLKVYPKHPKAIDVNFVLARAELGLGHADVAVGMLKQLAFQMPDGPERSHVEFEIGEIYRLETQRMDSARVYFQHVAAQGDRTPKRTAALIRLGDLDVYFGELAAADSSYRAAQAARPNQDESEEIAFRIAELRLFSKEYDGCATDLKGLVQRFPRGLYVNDALELKVLLTDSKDAMNWSLDRYAAGLYAWRRGMTDSALVSFGQIVADSANKLASYGLFQIAAIHTARTTPSEAVADYHSLIARYRDSHLVPRAWAAIGALYEGPLADRQQARAAYQTIIMEYKDSPLVEDARLHLQKLDVPQP